MKSKAERVETARQEWEEYLHLLPEDWPYTVDPAAQPAKEIAKGRGPIYSKVGHTKECEEASRRFQAQVDAFIDAHPGYCEVCGGWGGASSPGCSVPYGSTSVSLPDDWDPCQACLDKGLCPHCGRQLTAPGDAPAYCEACGWKEEDEPEGVPLDGPGCLCPDLYLDWEDDWL